MTKFLSISVQALPVALMVSLLFFTQNTLLLSILYIVPALIYFFRQPQKINIIVYLTGLFFMTIFESIFLLTGVETFADKSLFGIMPIWLPFLWAYGFLAIKDSLLILLKNK